MGELLTLDQLAVEGAKRLAIDHGFEEARAILVEMIERYPRVRYTVLELLSFS